MRPYSKREANYRVSVIIGWASMKLWDNRTVESERRRKRSRYFIEKIDRNLAFDGMWEMWGR